MFRRHRGPVMIAGPDGRMMPKKAADHAWKIHNRKQEQLGQIQVRERKHNAEARAADTDRDQAQKDRAVKTGRIAARWKKIGGVLQAFGDRLRNDLPLAFTLVTVAVSLTVTLSAQWMFYNTLPWPAAFKWLVVPLALLVESGSWTYGIHAQFLAAKGRPYGAQTRRMWLLALLATGMNSYHGATAFEGHWEMGLILGGGSLLGPAVWHGYVYLTKQRKTVRSAVQIRAAIGRRLHHPILTWRAHALWSESGGRISPEKAFMIVWLRWKGHLPWQAPSAVSGRSNPRREVTVATVRVRWSPAGFVPDSSAGTGAGSSAELRPPVIVSGADNSPSSPPALALVGGDGSADDPTLTGLDIDAEIAGIERMIQAVQDVPDRAETPTDKRAETADVRRSRGVSAVGSERSDGDGSGAGTDVLEGAEVSAGTPPKQRSDGGGRAPAGKRRRALRKGDREALVREFVARQLAGGVALESITGALVAVELGLPPSTARNLVAKIKSEMSSVDQHTV